MVSQAAYLVPKGGADALRALTQSGRATAMPAILRWLLHFRAVRHIPAHLFGYGFRREHVRTGEQPLRHGES